MMPGAVMTLTNGRTRGPSDDRASATDPSTTELETGSTITLLPLAARGDRRAVEILIERMRPYLTRFGHGRLPRWARSRAETEDLVQESLIRALNHLPRFENQSIKDFRSWLHTVFRNLVTDEKRFIGRVGVAKELPTDVEDPGMSPEERAVEQFLDVHQAQRDQGANHLHLRVHIEPGVLLAVDDGHRPQTTGLLAFPDRS